MSSSPVVWVWACFYRAQSKRKKERIKNRSINPTEKWLLFSLPLVTFLRVNYSSCFLPSVAGGQLLRLFQQKRRKRSSTFLPPSIITQTPSHFVSLFSPLSFSSALSCSFVQQREAGWEGTAMTRAISITTGTAVVSLATRHWTGWVGLWTRVGSKTCCGLVWGNRRGRCSIVGWIPVISDRWRDLWLNSLDCDILVCTNVYLQISKMSLTRQTVTGVS